MPTTDTNVPQVVVNKLTKAQYEAATKEPTEFYMVTDEQIETSDIADGAVTSEKIDFTTFKYSTTEQVVGTWIDGKPIYRKVVRINNPSTANAFYGIVDSNLDTCVKLYGTMVDSSGSKFPVPSFDSSETYSVIFLLSNGQLRGRFAVSSLAPGSVLLVAEYTKTTD